MSENIEGQSLIVSPFENRTGPYLNRRKLTIVSQTPTELIVDVTRIDDLDLDNGSKIDADTLNAKFQSIINQINTLDSGTRIKIVTEFIPELTFDSDPQTQINNEATTRANFDTSLQTQINNVTNNSTKISNSNGGFAAGNGAVSDGRGAAVGPTSWTTANGGAVGDTAITSTGGSIGNHTSSISGGAIGDNSKTGAGFAGGSYAQTIDVSGNGIDAIQLGAGTNNQTKTLQVYSDNIYDAASHTLNVNNANITTADITTLTNTTINNHGTINTTGLYTINGVQTGRNRTFIGTYTGGDGVTVPIGSLAAYSYFEIVFNGVSSRKISTGLISCADKTYFSVYYPNVGGIRGYKASDTSLRIEDTDGTTSFSVYGIN